MAQVADFGFQPGDFAGECLYLWRSTAIVFQVDLADTIGSLLLQLRFFGGFGSLVFQNGLPTGFKFFQGGNRTVIGPGGDQCRVAIGPSELGIVVDTLDGQGQIDRRLRCRFGHGYFTRQISTTA